MCFSRAGRVEEAAVHEEDGEFGEEDGGAVEHFGCVCQLRMRVQSCFTSTGVVKEAYVVPLRIQ